MAQVVIIGGGPGGYDAALAARRLGGEVTLIEQRGLGGSAVLTDVVPSKSLVSVGQIMARIREAGALGARLKDGDTDLWKAVDVDLAAVNERIRNLASSQSQDQKAELSQMGVRLVHGKGRLNGPHQVVAETDNGELYFPADVILLATGGHPRVLPSAQVDGERILTWAQIYDLEHMPEHLIIIGSGVTGAEFASAYRALGAKVTLVSSRHQVLPSEDDDAAAIIQQAFLDFGINVINDARAESVVRDGDEVVVTLASGEQVRGSHCLVAVGAIPNTDGIGLEDAGVALTESGHIKVDGVSRTSVRGIYAAGDCTDGMKLASVASAQGRIAMWHSLGDAVEPLNTRTVASAVFTTPEIATIGITQKEIDDGTIKARMVKMPLATNARTKMKEAYGGFVKLFCLPTTHIVVGGVIVSFWASELIHSVSIAVKNKLTVEQLGNAFAVYPTLSGSISEAARQLHGHPGEEIVLY
ncbi:MAG: NAD(P)H-quinone dehydrogenase [Propionibacteriaceae bacterium]|jgi:dihydrolipoamide dehydrogenase|nr:NAD(P)H-quinone dehydrogenase [Propionibacteriaceae bacterium]